MAIIIEIDMISEKIETTDDVCKFADCILKKFKTEAFIFGYSINSNKITNCNNLSHTLKSTAN